MNAVVKKCSIQISGVSQYTPEQQQKHGEPILLTYKLGIKKKNWSSQAFNIRLNLFEVA